jgi:phosphohistidine phosphatase
VTADPARQLVVLRHAKSEWPLGTPDHQRPLAARGRRDAPAAGAWLRESGHAPERVICSTARRARQTWALAAAELGEAPEVRYDDKVYDADVTDLLAVVRAVPDAVTTALIVGHNPGFQELVLWLAADGDDDGLDRAAVKFPTSAMAVLEFTGPWAKLAPGAAALAHFVVPRG